MVEEFDIPHGPLDALFVEPEFTRVAVLSDVHGNLPALEACLSDVLAEGVQAIFFLGDLTWGPQPREVLARVADLTVPAWFVRGNAERDVVELASGTQQPDGPDAEWMVRAHGPDGVRTIAGFEPAISIRTKQLDRIRFCHGSPRSDIELITPGTSPERMADATTGVADGTIGHGHTHLQYLRRLGERTVFGPGSVGIPYGTDNRQGARWALLADTIDLRVTEYDVHESIDIANAVGYPGAAAYAKYLTTPPTLVEIIEDAESLQFSD
jgi:predicted phosphodiesterase